MLHAAPGLAGRLRNFLRGGKAADYLVKRQGFGALSRIQQTFNRGAIPTTELVDDPMTGKGSAVASN